MLRCCLEMIIKTQHTGILLLEHRLTDFLDITDEIAVINRGSCVFHGSVSEYTAKSHHLAYATGIRFPGQRHPEDWKEHLDPIVPGEVTPIFTLEDVTAGFESSCLNSLNCSIYPGITALTGPNGSGKSTLAALLAGLITPVRGSISWSGHIKAPRLPDGRVVGLLQQDAAGMMFTNSVFSEISEGLCNYSVPSAAARVKHWLRIIDLSDASGCHPLQLSTGQIVRVATAAVMALQPRILILDEPSRGQDWEHFQTLLHQCVSCHQNAPESCIIITHDYKVIHRFAQWVIVLDQGKIVTQGKLRKYCYEN